MNFKLKEHLQKNFPKFKIDYPIVSLRLFNRLMKTREFSTILQKYYLNLPMTEKEESLLEEALSWEREIPETRIEEEVDSDLFFEAIIGGVLLERLAY